MTMERDIWITQFSEEAIPAFPCPQCKRGAVHLDTKTFRKEEPKYSETQHKDDAWEPEWIDMRFTGFLRCSDKNCGQIVVISGNVSHEQVMNDDFDLEYVEELTPKSL